jgi:hypothetical protein
MEALDFFLQFWAEFIALRWCSLSGPVSQAGHSQQPGGGSQTAEVVAAHSNASVSSGA